MENLSKKINELIQEQSAAGALTAQALKQMHEIAENSEKLAKHNESLQAELLAKTNRIKALDDSLDNMRADLKNLCEAESVMAKREKEITTLELTAKHESKRVEDHINMVGLVLRNTEVVKNMFGSTTCQDSNGYPINMPISETTTEEAK